MEGRSIGVMEILRTLAECDLNVSWASRVLRIPRTTLQTHLAIIEEATGLRPTGFYDLHKLLAGTAGNGKKETNKRDKE